MRILTLSVIGLVLPLFTSAQSWLHPSTDDYVAAIQQGFTQQQSKHKKIVPLSYTVGTNGQAFIFVFYPPLSCAQKFGVDARTQLEPNTDSIDIKKVIERCDGKLFLFLDHYDPFTSEGVPNIAFDATPTVKFHFDNTVYIGVTTYSTGSFYGLFSMARESCDPSDTDCYVGYHYVDSFFLRPDSAWNSKIQMRFSVPGTAEIISAQIDFSKMAKTYADGWGRK